MQSRIYALYRGDEFLFVGDSRECAAWLGVTVSSLYRMSMPFYRKTRKDIEKTILAYKIDETEEE